VAKGNIALYCEVSFMCQSLIIAIAVTMYVTSALKAELLSSQFKKKF